MLAIRMQRTGRRGHAQFRVIVQDSHFSPTSGRVVAYVGNYNPHTKAATLNGEKIAGYLDNGAQPSDGVIRLLQKEGIKLPDWVKQPTEKKRTIRHPDKLRRNRPKDAPAPEVKAEETPAAEDSATPEAPAEEPTATSEETAVEPAVEEPSAEAAPPTEEPAPAEESAAVAEEPVEPTETPVEEPAQENSKEETPQKS